MPQVAIKHFFIDDPNVPPWGGAVPPVTVFPAVGGRMYRMNRTYGVSKLMVLFGLLLEILKRPW